MKKKLTEQEESALWLLQRKGRILELQYALKMTKAEVLDFIEKLSEKLNCELLNKRDINNGKFWKAYGVVTPWGER